MALLTLGLVVLTIGLLIALTERVFWVLSLILFYRVLSSFVSFEMVQTHVGVESHLMYFILLVAVSATLHYFVVVRLLSEYYILKVPLFIGMALWVLYYYDFLELLLLKDWLVANGLWGTDNVNDSIKQLFSTPTDEMMGYISDGLKNISDTLWNILEKLTNGRIAKGSE